MSAPATEKKPPSGMEKKLANVSKAVRMMLQGIGSEETWKEAYTLAGGKPPTDSIIDPNE